MPRALGRSPVVRFGRRLHDAAAGAAALYRTSGNARIESLLGYLAVSAALAEGSAWRISVVVLATAAVLAVEGVNTAVEHAVDRIGLERHPLSRAAKDAAAGAVLVAALGALALAVTSLVPTFGACLVAWRRASLPDRLLWLAGMAAATVGAVRPEPPAQGRP